MGAGTQKNKTVAYILGTESTHGEGQTHNLVLESHEKPMNIRKSEEDNSSLTMMCSRF